MLKSSTAIKESPKKLNVPVSMVAGVFKSITVDGISRMTVNVKVVEVAGKRKQDDIIANQTGTARVNLWEDAMRDGESYQMKNLIIRDYQSAQYLSMSKDGTEITSIQDIGNVARTTRGNQSRECDSHQS